MNQDSTSVHGGETTSADSDVMAEFGITRVPVTYFHYKNFRYTSLDEALAQARREERAGPGEDRIASHFAKENMAAGQSRTKARQPDSPWCDTKGKNIVESGYTP